MNKAKSSYIRIPNHIFLSFLITAFAFLYNAQPVSTFIKSYETTPDLLTIQTTYSLGNTPYTVFRRSELISPLSDGSMVVAFNGKDLSNDEFRIVIMKLSPTGEVLWKKSQNELSFTNNTYVRPTCITIKDDIIYIAGCTKANSQWSSYVVRLDASGTILNNYIYHPTTPSDLNFIDEIAAAPKDILVDDDYVYVIGNTRCSNVSSANFGENIFALKLEHDLTFINHKLYISTDLINYGTDLIAIASEKMTCCERGNELFLFFHSGTYASPYDYFMGAMRIDKSSLDHEPINTSPPGDKVFFMNFGREFTPQKVFYDPSNDKFSIIVKLENGSPGFLQLDGNLNIFLI